MKQVKDAKYSHMGDKERIIHLKSFVVMTAQILEVYNDIDEVREDAELCNYEEQPDSILITGNSGAGKSTIIEHYLKKYPRQKIKTDYGEKDKIPVLYVKLPDDTNQKAAPTEILKAMLEPDRYKSKRGERAEPIKISGNRYDLNDSFWKLAAECEVELIIIDEFHNAIRTNTPVARRDAAFWLKTIINQTGIPLVLMGLPHCTDLLAEFPEVRSRFSIQHHLPEYSLETVEEWIKFLFKVDKNLPFDYYIGLSEPKLALRLLALTKGSLTVLMKKVIRPSARLAIKRGQSEVSVKDMITVSCERLKLPEAQNPLSSSVSFKHVEKILQQQLQQLSGKKSVTTQYERLFENLRV